MRGPSPRALRRGRASTRNASLSPPPPSGAVRRRRPCPPPPRLRRLLAPEPRRRLLFELLGRAPRPVRRPAVVVLRRRPGDRGRVCGRAAARRRSRRRAPRPTAARQRRAARQQEGDAAQARGCVLLVLEAAQRGGVGTDELAHRGDRRALATPARVEQPRDAARAQRGIAGERVTEGTACAIHLRRLRGNWCAVYVREYPDEQLSGQREEVGRRQCGHRKRPRRVELAHGVARRAAEGNERRRPPSWPPLLCARLLDMGDDTTIIVEHECGDLDTCAFTNDCDCDDGGPGAKYRECRRYADASDCGTKCALAARRRRRRASRASGARRHTRRRARARRTCRRRRRPAHAPPDVRAAARRVVGARFAQRRRQLARRRVRDADARRVAHDLRARRALHRERLRHVGRRPLVEVCEYTATKRRRSAAACRTPGGRRRHHAVRRGARAARAGRARRRRAEHAAGRRREGARRRRRALSR